MRHEHEPRHQARCHNVSYLASKANVRDVEDVNAVVGMVIDMSVYVVNLVRVVKVGLR